MTELLIWLAAVLLLFFAVPWIVFCVSWLVGRAWYAGRLAAIRSAFYKTGRKKCPKRKLDSGTKVEQKKT